MFWNLDLTWAFLNHFKFTHKKLESFKINITIRKSTEEDSLENSTIPIQFERVLMYVNPTYRGKLSKRLKVLMKEFKKTMGTDNFLHQTPSMTELFDFLNYYHEKVMKTVTLVDNFFMIIRRNESITEYNEEP